MEFHTSQPPPSTRNLFHNVSADIWLNIMASLDPIKDKTTLMAAALSCRALAYPSQASLFKFVQLRGNHSLEALYSISADTAEKVAKCCRYLRIHDAKTRLTNWDAPLDRLESFLGLCTGVQVLYLDFYDPEAIFLGTSNRSILARSRTQETDRLFHLLPKVHTVGLMYAYADIGLYFHVLNCFPSLQKLVIRHVYEYPFPEDRKSAKHVRADPPTFSLKSLSIVELCDEDALEWMRPAIMGIQRLSLSRDAGFRKDEDDSDSDYDYYESDDHPPRILSGALTTSFKKWLKGIGKSVTELTLEMTPSHQHIGPSAFVQLALLTPNIKSLNINCLNQGDSPVTRRQTKKAARDELLKIVPKLKYLEELTFDDALALQGKDIAKEISASPIFAS